MAHTAGNQNVLVLCAIAEKPSKARIFVGGSITPKIEVKVTLLSEDGRSSLMMVFAYSPFDNQPLIGNPGDFR